MEQHKFGGKVATIVLAVGALAVFGMFKDKSPSSGANEAPSSVSVPVVAPANAPSSPVAGTNEATYSGIRAVAPRYVDIAGGRTQPQASLGTTSPAQGNSTPEQSTDRELSFVERTTPRYPPQAIRQRHEGTTILQVTVNESGKVENVSIEASSGYRELDRAAQDAARHWTFNPAINDGQPATAILRTPVNFSLSAM